MTQKKTQQKRREMSQAVYQALETGEKNAFIAQRIQESREKHRSRKQGEALKKEQLARGIEFIEADLGRKFQDVLVFQGSIGGAEVVAGAMLVTTENGPAYQVTYSICSPRDVANFETGLSWVGWRIQPGEKHHHPHNFAIRMSRKGALRPQKLAALIRVHIEMDVVTGRISLSNRVTRAVVLSERIAQLRDVDEVQWVREQVQAHDTWSPICSRSRVRKVLYTHLQ